MAGNNPQVGLHVFHDQGAVGDGVRLGLLDLRALGDVVLQPEARLPVRSDGFPAGADRDAACAGPRLRRIHAELFDTGSVAT